MAVVGMRGESRRAGLAGGFLCSVVLHGLLLLPIVLMLDRVATTLVIPVDVVLADETEGAPPPDTASAPPREAETAASPAAAPLGILPSDEHPPDELEQKLRRLAALRQPGPDTPLLKSDASPSRVSPISNGVGESLAVSDFIRAQVERRWGLDLARLGNKTFSVLIRVEMTGAGVVTKAEIVHDARFAADKAYQDIAFSARNAVLLSSPFALPSGHYADVMQLTLSLNTADALR
jgi:hypothetical protein